MHAEIYVDRMGLSCVSSLYYDEDNSEIILDLNEIVNALADIFQIISFRSVEAKHV